MRVELSYKQAKTIAWACEHVSRMLLGDFNDMELMLSRKDVKVNHDDACDAAAALKLLYFPDFVAEYGTSGNWGVGSKHTREETDVLHDIAEVLNYHLSWAESLTGNPMIRGRMRPLRASQEKLIHIEDDHTLMIYIDFFRRFEHSIRRMLDDVPERKKKILIETFKNYALEEYEYVVTNEKPLPDEKYKEWFP